MLAALDNMTAPSLKHKSPDNAPSKKRKVPIKNTTENINPRKRIQDKVLPPSMTYNIRTPAPPQQQSQNPPKKPPKKQNVSKKLSQS
jgi:hypothetical protein